MLHTYFDMLIVGTIFVVCPVVFILLYLLLNYFVAGTKCVCVVVLGDIGRSPRMQYHSLSFIESGFHVDIVGYGGSELQKGLQKSDQVDVHFLSEPPKVLKVFPRLLVYILKVLWQMTSLGVTLLLMPKCRYILMQNPPCIPTLFVCLTVCWLRGSRLVIDWHNYGYTILGLALGASSPLVRFAKWYEHFLGWFASANICVTDAMRKDLHENWAIKATVMYDRPPAMFKAVGLTDRHKLFTRLAHDHPAFRFSDRSPGNESVFTTVDNDGTVMYRQGRPVLLVSSTSWTEDEDFGILLEALKDYESDLQKGRTDLPDIVCVITGKGPQKEHYRGVIESQTWNHVHFCLPWLTPEDYPLLLGSADLGVCLHFSSSGLDLPMKVVDMFGCGLPVCAIQFQCLHELVKHEENGLIFENSKMLFQQIQELLEGFPHGSVKLQQFHKNLSKFQSERWHQCWEQTVLPLFIDETSDKQS